MAYGAVYLYADEGASTYSEYQLIHQPVQFGDEEIETETARYTRTTEDEWDQITDEEVGLLRDVDGEIRYEKVFQ